MKILVTGAGGMLGTDISDCFREKFETVGVERKAVSHLKIPYDQVDLADVGEVGRCLGRAKPDLVFHTAAMTNVDACESERQGALRDNLETTQILVQNCNRLGSFLVFISTDYVFDGCEEKEYEEGDPVHPLSYYGETKYLAEKYICEKAEQFTIVRLSWLYGYHGRCFPRTILEKAAQESSLKVVHDQVGRPTYTRDVANVFYSLLSQDEKAFQRVNREIFHLANDGVCSWFEFAVAVLKVAGYGQIRVTPATSDEVKRPAERPSHAVLSLKKTQDRLGIRLRCWKDALQDFIQLLKERDVLNHHA